MDKIVKPESTETLFRCLQEGVSLDQFEALEELDPQVGSILDFDGIEDEVRLLCDLPGKSAENPETEKLISLDDGLFGDPSHSLSSSGVWDLLRPGMAEDERLDCDYDADMEVDGQVLEDVDCQVLQHADVAKRASMLSDLQHIGGHDISSIAQTAPEMLAKYLTGSLSFEELLSSVDGVREQVEETTVPRKMRQQRAPGKQAECKENETTVEDEFWTPNGPCGRKYKKVRHRQYFLPKSLLPQMGQVHSLMASGQLEQALDKCSELVRKAPKSSEPYETLAHVYDEQGDTAKATEFFLIAAYLKRSDSDTWVDLANRLLGLNKPQKAMQCINQAIRFASADKRLELMQERICWYEQTGQGSKALSGYSHMLTAMDSGPASGDRCDDDQYLQLARKVCQTYHGMKRTNDAARVLATMFRNRPSLVNSEDTNKLLDLRLAMWQYQACLEGLVDYCGVEAELNAEELPQDVPGCHICRWSQSSALPDGVDLKTTPGLIRSVHLPADIPGGFPLPLLSILCICLIHLGLREQSKHLVAKLMQEDVDESSTGEMALDVAEAYMETNSYHSALPIVERCICSSWYSKAAVWLQYGECLSAVRRLEEAVLAFRRVVELAPHHLGARISLSTLQQRIGRPDDALEALTNGDAVSSSRLPTDHRLLLQTCNVLLEQSRITEFLESARSLLFHYFKDMFRPEYMRVVLQYRSQRHRIEVLRSFICSRTDKNLSLKRQYLQHRKDKRKGSGRDTHVIGPDELWGVFIKVCQVMLKEEQLEELMELSLLALVSPIFNKSSKRIKEAEFLCLTVCLMARNGRFAYNFTKTLCLQGKVTPTDKTCVVSKRRRVPTNWVSDRTLQPSIESVVANSFVPSDFLVDGQNHSSLMAWNLFNQCIMCSTDVRHCKFCLLLAVTLTEESKRGGLVIALGFDHPGNIALSILVANNSFSSGNYRCALGQYMSVFKHLPHDPLLNLLVGLCYMHISCQRLSNNKHWLIMQGLVFLNVYQHLRGECQESLYNIGRALHQIGIGYAAVYYYKRALSLPPIIEDENGTFDLRMETAYNLAQIYRKSGNYHLARLYTHTYMVV